MIYWFYGQPGSGKTTLGNALENRLLNDDPSLKIVKLDGDELREIFNNKDYTPTGRKTNMKQVTDIVRFLSSKGFVVIVSVVAPYLESREVISDLNPTMIYLWTDMVRGREHFATKDMQIGENDYQLKTDEPDQEFDGLVLKSKSIDKCLDEVINFSKNKEKQ